MSSYSELCVEVEPSKMLKQTLSMFLSCLYANPLILRNTIQIIIDGMETVLTEGVASYIKNSAEKMLSRDQISVECFGSFINITNYIKNEALTDLKTEYKRFSYFTEQGTYIEPKEIVIGQRLNKVIRGGVSILEPSNCTQQFIPLRNVLKKFFSVENVVIETLEYIKTLKSEHGVLRNFIQGTYWKSRVANHNERIVLPLFMFFDYFEIGNALGSHSGIHKLGGVYVSVPCLPPYHSIIRVGFVQSGRKI